MSTLSRLKMAILIAYQKTASFQLAERKAVINGLLKPKNQMLNLPDNLQLWLRQSVTACNVSSCESDGRRPGHGQLIRGLDSELIVREQPTGPGTASAIDGIKEWQ